MRILWAVTVTEYTRYLRIITGDLCGQNQEYVMTTYSNITVLPDILPCRRESRHQLRKKPRYVPTAALLYRGCRSPCRQGLELQRGTAIFGQYL